MSAVEQLQTKATETVTYIASLAAPYTPTVVKDGVIYTANTAQTLSTSALETANQTAATLQSHANQALHSATSTLTATQEFANQKASEAFTLGKEVVGQTANTITSYTPDPVVALVNKSLENAQALRTDPIGTVKSYTPDFVIQVGEKTYEVVAHTTESAKKTVDETSGFIVTKVNGTVDYITHIPQVESLMAELKKLIPGNKKEE
ncbi:hypothetical protein HK099_006093 [Clydaea vesicula]|uniref:Uncharacterized protein n=1 Tax=Clydaea vesicula TaxID=447962 RepID=A0AAD5XUJ5_9FUNG|nr:hypothetical protein HK099_006093 [Clydaea vesicula]KAJ3380255.1 hypothetical protein HDU92_006087 [Lobulomyces angularis]